MMISIKRKVNVCIYNLIIFSSIRSHAVHLSIDRYDICIVYNEILFAVWTRYVSSKSRDYTIINPKRTVRVHNSRKKYNAFSPRETFRVTRDKKRFFFFFTNAILLKSLFRNKCRALHVLAEHSSLLLGLKRN